MKIIVKTSVLLVLIVICFFQGAHFEDLPRCPASAGLFPYPGNCGRYLLCSRGVAFVQQCAEGLHFSPKTLKCDIPKNAECTETGLRSQSSSTGPCQCEGCVLPHKDNCTSYTVCVNQITYTKKCGRDLRFNPAIEDCDFKEKVQCKKPECTTGSGVIPYPSSTTCYIECQNRNQAVRRCNPGFTFDIATKCCIASKKQNEVLPKCPAPEGVFPYPGDHRRFIFCSCQEPSVKWCPDGFRFDPRRLVCGKPSDKECAEATPTLPPPKGFCDCKSCIFPNRDDCGAYIVCLNHVRYEMQCGKGLRFNPETENCDLAERVQCPVVSCQSEFGKFPYSGSFSLYIECNYWMPTVKRCQEGFSFDAAQRCCVQSHGKSPALPKCPRPAGRFPYPGDCRRYLECSNGISWVKWCPDKLHFDARRLSCEWAEDAGCGATNPSKRALPAPSGSCSCDCCFLPVKEDCTSYIYCFNGNQHRMRCPDGYHFDPKGKRCDRKEKVNCRIFKCPKPDCRLPHPDGEDKYIQCKWWIPTVKKCYEGQKFDPVQKVCIRPGGNVQCPCKNCAINKEGDCSSYVVCTNGVGHVKQCPQDHVYNCFLRRCEPLNQLICSNNPSPFQCHESNSLHSHPWDCTKYIECYERRPVVRHCANNLHFDPHTKRCVSSRYANCKKCPVLNHYHRCFEREGRYPVPGDCSSFVECSSWVKCKKTCPRGLHFDPVTKSCRHPCIARCVSQIGTSTTTTPDEGVTGEPSTVPPLLIYNPKFNKTSLKTHPVVPTSIESAAQDMAMQSRACLVF